MGRGDQILIAIIDFRASSCWLKWSHPHKARSQSIEEWTVFLLSWSIEQFAEACDWLFQAISQCWNKVELSEIVKHSISLRLQ